MTIRSYFSLAVTNFRRNALRTMLTGLGIVISIASVIIVISAAQGVRGYIIGQFDAYGNNILNIETKLPAAGKNSTDNAQAQAFGNVITTLKLDDMKAVLRLPNIKNAYAGQLGQAVVAAWGQKKTVNIFGVSASYLDIDTATIGQGRFFTKNDDDSLARVVVLGSTVAQDIFGDTNPIGQNLKIKNRNFEVIGVFKTRGASLFMDYDGFVFMPVQTLQKQVLGIDYVSFILTQYQDASRLPATIASVEDLLRQRHKIDLGNPDKDDFSVQSMADVTNILDTVIGGFTILLIILAGISLLVGGVGIMNIMYVSVLERTFEIGLRKAVGATRQQILRQFLMEAVLITTWGGISGIILGVIVSYGISALARQLGFSWTFSVPVYSIVLSTSFSVICGLVFGLYPARQAATLDPIEALRNE